MKFLRQALAACSLIAATALPAQAQEVTLKLHFFLSSTSFASTLFIQPWCDKIARESVNRMKCQLYDQLRDGVVDVMWTLPGYTAGRFPSREAVELPFMM